ncbi:TonB-dependent receptor [Parapedobacter koreensis]|uniref:Outer membrane receptor proteins, mostly Fe transport n=1 Tax=Parapedobacter koreensis TaxID=332977 RepID=A0A1H7TKD6_9SPHI|nr:TonB-dependent receptor [Parapedobacter koreensis]SEL85310.1 Outer membrane receptor proteins, mostly Fe transport [Parapedobacter koreensis]
MINTLCVTALAAIGTLCGLSATAQSLRGRVVDEDRNPVEGAYVFNMDSKAHAHSDAQGVFFLEKAVVGDSLTVSHRYYHTVAMQVGSTDSITIVLGHKVLRLDEVVITENLKHLNTFAAVDLEIQPVATSQDLLRKVPGLFIGQHAGGGKAEQLFLRGFDVDHGTDVGITIDGMPVNMVSHAHGQGYADLHFVIPETVERIDFDKGSYFADKGDFVTAGYVAFETKDRLANNAVALDLGQFNTTRALGLFNLLDREGQSAYFAGEYMLTDNYFDAPQNFSRINLFGKYTATTGPRDKVALSLSHFTSQWDASGQIPDRAVRSGLISHFGAVDPTEGGQTSRSNFNVQYDHTISDRSRIKNSAYLSKYDFELYSNFTFFLNDPEHGDQIRQRENRTITGFQSEYQYTFDKYADLKLGMGLRNDNDKDVELSHTVNRQTVLEYLSLGDLNQTNLFSYAAADFSWGNWLINTGLRLDYFKFNYVDKLTESYHNQLETKAILSPKVNFLYTPHQSISYFLKLGKGFHSNDARVVVAQQGQDILPASYNADLGLVWKPAPRLMLNAALWYLFLEQEFVYVGDEAVVEPSGKTQRKGVDFGLRYQFNDWLFWNTDFTYTHARAMDEPSGADYIPLAPVTTLVNGLSIKNYRGLSGSIRTRLLGDRPANEENSVHAAGYFITDFSLHYQLKNVSIGVNVDNAFNTKWKETQFLTESRLREEAESVEEIHYTPGTPFSARLMLQYRF